MLLPRNKVFTQLCFCLHITICILHGYETESKIFNKKKHIYLNCPLHLQYNIIVGYDLISFNFYLYFISELVYLDIFEHAM